MGAGQPSKITEEQLKHVDVVIPTEFAKASKVAGCVKHISLLSSVGADASCKPSRLTGTVAGGGLYLGLKGQVSHFLHYTQERPVPTWVMKYREI